MRNQDTSTSDGGVTAARSDARISRGQAMVVVAIITLLYSVFPNRYPRFVSPNELSRILLTKSIVDEGTFVIDSGIRRTGEFGDLARFRGHYYSDKAPGLSLIAVPVYFVGRTFAGHQLNEIDAILLCKIVTVTIPAILFALFLVMTWGRSYVGAALVVFALFLGTPVFPQALTFTAHVPMTILCFLAAHRIRSYGDVSLRSAILAGALAGAAVLMDMSALISAQSRLSLSER